MHDFEGWITTARTQVNSEWLMYAEPIRMDSGQDDMYEYYYVDVERQLVAWKQAFSTEVLFQESAYVGDKEHLSMSCSSIAPSICSDSFSGHELRAQFWKHVEYFSFKFQLHQLEIHLLCQELHWLYVGGCYDFFPLPCLFPYLNSPTSILLLCPILYSHRLVLTRLP